MQPQTTSDAAPKVRGLGNAGFGDISDADAAELIAEHGALVQYVLGRLGPWLRRSHVKLESGDLQNIGQVALIRAWLTWDPRRGAWSTHAVFVVRRWLIRAAGLEQGRVVRDPALSTDPWVLETSETLGASVDNEDETIERIERNRLLEWLRTQISSPRISTRQRVVLEQVLAGKTFDEIARAESISRQGVAQTYEAAIEKLRRFAERDAISRH